MKALHVTMVKKTRDGSTVCSSETRTVPSFPKQLQDPEYRSGLLRMEPGSSAFKSPGNANTTLPNELVHVVNCRPAKLIF